MRQTAEDLQHLPKRVLQGAEELQEPHQHLLEDKLLHLVGHQLQEDKQPLLLNHKLSLADQQPVHQLSPEDHQPVLQLSLGHLQLVLPMHPEPHHLWVRQASELQEAHQHQSEDKHLYLADHQSQEDKQPLLLSYKLSQEDHQPVLQLSLGHHQPVLQLSQEDHQPVLQLSLGHLQPVLPTISLWRRQ